MQIFFLRHGEAARHSGLADADRPLTDHGLAQARAVGRAFARWGIRPDVVLCSPLLRARQTAETACAVLSIPEVRMTELLAPDADPRQLFTELRSLDAECLLLVGHQPFVGEAVSLLVAGDERLRIVIAPGTLLSVSLEDGIEPGSGRLEALLPHSSRDPEQG